MPELLEELEDAAAPELLELLDELEDATSPELLELLEELLDELDPGWLTIITPKGETGLDKNIVKKEKVSRNAKCKIGFFIFQNKLFQQLHLLLKRGLDSKQKH